MQVGSCYEDVTYQYIFDDSYHYHAMFLTLPGLVEAALDHMAPNCTLTFPQYLIALFHYCSNRKVKWHRNTLYYLLRGVNSCEFWWEYELEKDTRGVCMFKTRHVH